MAVDQVAAVVIGDGDGDCEGVGAICFSFVLKLYTERNGTLCVLCFVCGGVGVVGVWLWECAGRLVAPIDDTVGAMDGGPNVGGTAQRCGR